MMNNSKTQQRSSARSHLGAYILFIALAITLTGAACAYDSTDRGFEWRTNHSSNIVIGQIIDITSGVCVYESRCATVNVLSSAKGTNEQNILVLFDGPISELKPSCCIKGGTYLLYLREVKSDSSPSYYESSDGRFGAYRLDQTRQ